MDEKRLVDANKITEDISVDAINPGDLVRIKVLNGKDKGCAFLAICNQYLGEGKKYYTTQDGCMRICGAVKVIEIIGKCVFSVYR